MTTTTTSSSTTTMMCHDDVRGRIERTIEVYENERLWIGRGFSKSGLIPTERGPYSTRDGSVRWRTSREAGMALLGTVGDGDDGGERGTDDAEDEKVKDKVVVAATGGARRIRGRGWSFREGEEDRRRYRGVVVPPTDDDNDDRGAFVVLVGASADGPTDVDGWQYHHDFSTRSLSSPNPRRGMMDFVRHRKLSRVAYFRPDHFLSREVYSKCDYCDSKVVDALSSAMLDALALAILFKYGTKYPASDARLLPLKFRLIDYLTIGHNYGDDENDRDPSERMDEIKDRLCAFAETCVGRPGHAMAQILNPDFNRNLEAAMLDARATVSRHFDERERACLARLLIKDVDRRAFKMHCWNEYCGMPFVDDDPPPPCEFRLVSCSNKGCVAVFSYKYRDEHDAECEYKPCPCPNDCGADIPRCEVNAHVRDKCSFRQTACPLSTFGCNTIVHAQDVACHLNDHADKHFTLVANRMTEYESVMKDMRSRIRVLEENNARLERELKEAIASFQSKENAKSLVIDVNKLAKRLRALEGKCQSEFKQVQNDRRNHIK